MALYGKGGRRWSMTERGRHAIDRREDLFRIGPSSMRWEDGALVIDIDEVTVPLPSRLIGRVRLMPSTVCSHEVPLDPEGLHRWRPIAPFSRIEAAFDRPGLAWSGVGYHDSNWGSVPLEESFESWVWARAAGEDGARIIYDTVLRDGTERAFALEIGQKGAVRGLAVPPRQDMPTTFWRMRRHMRDRKPFRIAALLEDSPFYARSLLQLETEDGMAYAFHESLSLRRFSHPLIQMMLPFRMPRRG